MLFFIDPCVVSFDKRVWQVFWLFWDCVWWGNSASAAQILPCSSLNKSWEKGGAANERLLVQEVRFAAGSKQASRSQILTTAPCLVQDVCWINSFLLNLEIALNVFGWTYYHRNFSGPSNQTGTVLKWTNVSYPPLASSPVCWSSSDGEKHTVFTV